MGLAQGLDSAKWDFLLGIKIWPHSHLPDTNMPEYPPVGISETLVPAMLSKKLRGGGGAYPFTPSSG